MSEESRRYLFDLAELDDGTWRADIKIEGFEFLPVIGASRSDVIAKADAKIGLAFSRHWKWDKDNKTKLWLPLSIKKANDGCKDSAAWLLQYAASHIENRQPMPYLLSDWLVVRLRKIAAGQEANTTLNMQLKRGQRSYGETLRRRSRDISIIQYIERNLGKAPFEDDCHGPGLFTIAAIYFSESPEIARKAWKGRRRPAPSEGKRYTSASANSRAWLLREAKQHRCRAGNRPISGP